MSEIGTGINGFGRIGKSYARIALDDDSLAIAAIAGRNIQPESAARGLVDDEIHGVYLGHNVSYTEDAIVVDEQSIPLVQASSPEAVNWRDYGDSLVVIESTGAYTTRESAARHLGSGAAKVVITAPAKDTVTPTIVRGVNDSEECLASVGDVVAVSSCSTNCMAPILKIIDNKFSIMWAKGHMAHAETTSQKEKGAIIPAPTGSSREVERLFPQWGSNFSSVSNRVPVGNGSQVYLTIQTGFGNGRQVEREDVIEALQSAEQSPQYTGVVETTHDYMDSNRVIGRIASAVIDLNLVTVDRVNGRSHVSIAAFFDNEWGYANRVAEVVTLLARTATTS